MVAVVVVVAACGAITEALFQLVVVLLADRFDSVSLRPLPLPWPPEGEAEAELLEVLVA